MTKIYKLLLGAALSVNFGSCFAQDYSQVDKILGFDSENIDRFGQSTSIDGTTCVVGAPLNDYDENGENYVDDAGAAYIYSWNPGGEWTLDQKVVPILRDENFLYGESVSISGDYMVVGAPRNNNDTVSLGGLHTGAAYFYERNAMGEWVLAKRVFASDSQPNAEFGASVSISGDYAIIGSPKRYSVEIGRAYVFKRDEFGEWNEIQMLDPTSDYIVGAEFGKSVSISDDRMVVGAHLESEGSGDAPDDYVYRGGAYIYELDEFDVWNEVQHIVASDYTGGSFGGGGSFFGFSVSLVGDDLIVGAPGEGYDEFGWDHKSLAGAAYLFERGADGVWTETEKIVASDRDDNDEFGYSVSILGDMAVIGAHEEDEDVDDDVTLFNPGSAYIIENSAWGWSETQKIVADDRGSSDYFGTSVFISENYISIGARSDDPDASGTTWGDESTGSVYIFTPCGSSGSSMTVTECSEYTVPSGDTTYTVSGVYSDTLSNYYGCDSILTIDLTILATTSSISESACYTYTVPSGDETYTTTGVYTDTITNAAGCDSVITINLTINGTTTSSITEIVCDSYTVPSGDETYTTSGIYTDTIPSAVGCDSIITIDLTINTFSTSSIEVTTCDSYTVPSGDATYTTSGIYTDVIPNAAGCDSIITIDLTINYSTTVSITETVCDSYTVPSGDETYTTSGVYTDTIPNAVGCDSVITIDLTVLYSTTVTLTEVVCYSYTVPSGDETYTESGIYMDTIPNAAGCDSIITIDLTINNATTASITEMACFEYVVPSGDETYTESGIYMDTIPNTAGCDSIITIDLTINFATTSSITEEACFEYTVPSGDETYTESGIYMDTIANAAGCDSIITIDLTINTVNVETTTESPTITANAVGATYHWLDCDADYAVIDGETNASFTAASNGNYAVEVTEGGCTDTSACVTIGDVGLSAPDLMDIVRVYPNPGQGELFIDLGELKEVNMEIYNSRGEVVYHEENVNESLHIIDPELASGIYYLQVVSGTAKQEFRLIRL